MRTEHCKSLARIILLIIVSIAINDCKREAPVQPEKPCIDDQPVEDTTRVYLWPRTRDTLKIHPKMIYAAFYPWVTDTAQIEQLVEKHGLRFYRPLSSYKRQLTALLCITDGRRPEYYFTPYGKEGFCNFGADSLVEYAFGVFDQGKTTLSGHIIFTFDDTIPGARIDSLIQAHNLRFVHISPDFPSGKRYWTMVTPQTEKNVLDLTFELQSVPFARFVDLNFSSGPTKKCNE